MNSRHHPHATDASGRNSILPPIRVPPKWTYSQRIYKFDIREQSQCKNPEVKKASLFSERSLIKPKSESVLVEKYMLSFDDDEFLAGYVKRFGPLKTDLATAIKTVLGFIEADTRFSENPTDRYKIAYILATFKWETAHTFKPIDEFGGADYFEGRYGHLTNVGKRLGNTAAGDGAKFHGRGYVQLTGRANYQRASDLFLIDLIGDPDKAKKPKLAYDIAIYGMTNGSFTGKKLSQFFKPGQPPDYDSARSIINGKDQYQKIADIARRFDELLVTAIAP